MAQGELASRIIDAVDDHRHVITRPRFTPRVDRTEQIDLLGEGLQVTTGALLPGAQETECARILFVNDLATKGGLYESERSGGRTTDPSMRGAFNFAIG